MNDIVVILLTLFLYGLCALYIVGLERLGRKP